MKAVVFHGVADGRIDDVPSLVQLVRTRSLGPIAPLSQHTPASSAIEAYEQFDRHEQGWLKVGLEPAA